MARFLAPALALLAASVNDASARSTSGLPPTTRSSQRPASPPCPAPPSPA
eukprot:CAMPEP_0204112422 /NCGR_PEP_ID=MMETSP0361-20130328/3048_1 /ASSEMBLY_ACC=CAM_ASM_000343 /TAXON_ID=268821 /ORGANISM="Scrippsiella Hangoei, Strain SHTV-5" /LENGTH=49 /DNA_ID= /DNA_START= /DNA_END= /DNA_ORIENTATION=